MSTKTSGTISTTGQTGHLFTTSFKAGFLERNKDLLKGGSFVEEPLRGIEAFPKGGDGPWVYKKNEEGLIMKNQKLGDIDVKVFLRSAATVRDLFPSSGVQISNPTLELPEDQLTRKYLPDAQIPPRPFSRPVPRPCRFLDILFFDLQINSILNTFIVKR